jgi:hypothetical protein
MTAVWILLFVCHLCRHAHRATSPSQTNPIPAARSVTLTVRYNPCWIKLSRPININPADRTHLFSTSGLSSAETEASEKTESRVKALTNRGFLTSGASGHLVSKYQRKTCCQDHETTEIGLVTGEAPPDGKLAMA